MRDLTEKVVKTACAKPFAYFTGAEVLWESLRDRLGVRPGDQGDNEEHLRHLVSWLCRAQDATPDGGVSRSYSLIYQPFFRKKGWLASYPETTGYIIPTFYDYAHFTGQEEYRRRAAAMADWECAIQMPSGAVMGGTADFEPSEAVFNTGQVIFGWCRAHIETGEGRYLDAARRAGDYLVAVQDPDGAWMSRGSSRYAAHGSTVYNTRCSWALTLLDSLLGDGKYRVAAAQNVDWALTKQRGNGWFADNCLDDAQRPLVHTIAYAVQGVLETGVVLEEERYVQAALRSATAMAELLREDGSLAGRYDEHWRPAASWSCLTGNMQMSIVWSRLHQLGLGERLKETAAVINRFNRSLHDLRASSPGRRGGVKGAYPVYGDYGTFEYLNWAVKFTVDALLMEERTRRNPRVRDAEQRGARLFWGT